MSDPLDRLRGQPSDSRAPSSDLIKQRAGRIQARRRALVGSSAAVALAAMGLVAVLGGDVPDATTQLAEKGRTPTAQPRTATEEAAGGLAQTEEAQGFSDVGEGAAPGRAPAADAGDSSAATTGGAGGGAARDASSAEDLEVTLNATPSQSKEEHRLVVRACNPNDHAVDVTFPSAQRYDFEISKDGEVVWRWSAGKGFAQIVGTETWPAGDCREFSEVWRGERTHGGFAGPGSYSAVGMLSSSQEQRTDPVDVCRISCL